MDGSDSCMIGKEVMRLNYDDVELTHTQTATHAHTHTQAFMCKHIHVLYIREGNTGCGQ